MTGLPVYFEYIDRRRLAVIEIHTSIVCGPLYWPIVGTSTWDRMNVTTRYRNNDRLAIHTPDRDVLVIPGNS